jgi:hypothetical protein
VRGSESTVQSSESTVQSSGSTVRGSESTVQSSESTVRGSESTVQSSESTVRRSESTVQSSVSAEATVPPGRTDWNAYYLNPATFAPLTRWITKRGILRDVERFRQGAPLRHVAELGGGNSTVLGAFRARFPDARLSAIDSNALGLRLLEARTARDADLSTIEADVLAPVVDALGADLVFSVGLVEHFGAGDTARAIGAHFAHVRPGGLVLITFPTPTWLYRLARGIAEAAGVWAFPDERPLDLGEVTREMRRHGDVLGVRINWPIVFTQGVVVARRLQK